MKRASRTLKGELHDKMSAAIEIGTIGVFTAALLAVGREGLETALFLYPTFQAQGAGAGPALGALLGIGTAVVIGVLLYRGVVSMNLAVFFKVTGAALIVIAAGVLAYGVHDLQEAGILPGIDTLAWDIDGWEITSWYGALLKGIFNLGPQMTVLEIAVYLGYLDPDDGAVPAARRARAPHAPACRTRRAAAVGEPARPLTPDPPHPSHHVPTRSSTMSPRRVTLAVPAVALLALSACSTESADSTVEVTGTDDACVIAQDIVDAGKVGFDFTNESQQGQRAVRAEGERRHARRGRERHHRHVAHADGRPGRRRLPRAMQARPDRRRLRVAVHGHRRRRHRPGRGRPGDQPSTRSTSTTRTSTCPASPTATRSGS